jgi:capsid protein
MKMPALVGPDGTTSLREYAGYHGGAGGFGGQLRAWNPPTESADAALLPNFARETPAPMTWCVTMDTPQMPFSSIRITSSGLFPSQPPPELAFLGIAEEESRAFSREVEAAWKEFAEDDNCYVDVERKRTFTMMIREGVAMHAFNGELCTQPTWDTGASRLFRTQFKMVSPKRISNPGNTGDTRNCRAGVSVDNNGAAVGYYVSEDGYPGWMPQKWTYIPANCRVAGHRLFMYLNPWKMVRHAVPMCSTASWNR